jgi:two-component system, sensor histidine kinase and response regulator
MTIKIRGAGEKNMTKQRMDILKNVVIFSEANNTILKRLSESLIDVYVKKDQEVFHKGDRLDSMYIIVKGKVNVHDSDHVFTQFSDNDFFGEYSLIDSSVRSASVTAVDDTHLLRLDQKDFNDIIEDDFEVTKSILKALIKRLRNYNILEEKLTQNGIQIKKQHDELEKQRRALEEINITKDKFFTIIAHDLKNPFNTVIGLSELLMERYDTYDATKIKDFIFQINKFSNNAFDLLDNLLQWAKSQTGKIKIDPQKIDIFELANENLNLFKVTAAKKGIHLTSVVDIGLFVFADKNMISTIIRNLISNAIKFTPRGGKITMKASIKEEFIHFTVADTGIGITNENLSRLFKIEDNVTTLGTEDEVGTGLGLIICKEFVEKNGGTIWAKSSINEGTQFTFSIPAIRS